MIESKECHLPGCLQLFPNVHEDERGQFIKIYQQEWFSGLGLPTSWPEMFQSRSRRGVIRGLHFQLPPSAYDKLVYCSRGKAFDVVVDLRVGSPTFGEFEIFNLDDEQWSALYIPKGLAHGFAALADDTVMAYAVTTVHDAAADAGIRWNSLSIPWPFDDPSVSDRDGALPSFGEFQSPFVYDQ